MKKFFKVTCGALFAFSLLYYSLIGFFYCKTPSVFITQSDENFSICGSTVFEAREIEKTESSKNEKIKNMRLMAFGVFPIREVTAKVTEEKSVILGGEPFGIKFRTEGVMVTALTSVSSKNGSLVSPAASGGLRVGDYLLSINGEKMTTNEDIAAAVKNSGGKALSVVYQRGSATKKAEIHPALCSDNSLKIGLWVKDSSAGIGTMTFIDPENETFAGLGHPIIDSTSGEIMIVGSGEITDAEIQSVKKGAAGIPGELEGRLYGSSVGSILTNCETGVFGHFEETPNGEEIKIGYKQEVRPGKAEIVTTLDSEGPKRYEIQIEKINLTPENKTKNMIIKVTDKELLQKTGGIVQGMSGSPIIQNGKLVGAVTHVFVNDPTRGYAIFAENMLETAENIAESNQLKEAS